MLQKSFFSSLLSCSKNTIYGNRYTVSLIPGDGIGKELCDSVLHIFSSLQIPIDFEQVSSSSSTTPTEPGISKRENSPIGKSEKVDILPILDSLRRNNIGLKGIFHTPSHGNHISANLAIRKNLDIFANVVHIKSMIPNLKSQNCSNSNFPPFSSSTHSLQKQEIKQAEMDKDRKIDFVLIRENMEGEYSGLEHWPIPGQIAESLKVITRRNSERIIKFAFDYALKNNRKKITCVHKANIMKMSDGLFLECFKEISTLYKSIEINDMIIDNTAMQLVSKPEQFDVIVTPNLYGNIVTNIGTGLVGGAGLIPGYNIGNQHVIFEPGARHVGLDLAGSNKANPISMILSSCLMLDHLGLTSWSKIIRQSIHDTIIEGIVTADIGGSASTTLVCDAIVKNANRRILQSNL